MVKTGPANRYDLLKFIALAVMIVDHVGLFLLPDAEFLRAVGRVAFPSFLFLVGYSGSGRVTKGLVVGALLLILTDALTFRPIFPLNVLVAIGAVWLLLPRPERRDAPIELWSVCAFWLLPS